MVLAGTLLGDRYQLDQPIGSGGYSEVWCASDTVLSRSVAVKLLHPGYAQHPDALTRFQAEARHAGAMAHQNIARVYDYGEPEGEQPFLVMELVEGPSLAHVLMTGPLDAARTMDVLAQAACGLQAAHSEGLIHRDIKPGNLLLAPGGTVKITDFGIAHAVGSAPLTLTGTLLGTPGYLAPERASGAQATPATDLYALGIVAYECLAGAPPFAGTPLDVTLAHRDRPLPPLPADLPLNVVAFVMELAAKDPRWRPGSADEVAQRAAHLRDEPGPRRTRRTSTTRGRSPAHPDRSRDQARSSRLDPARPVGDDAGQPPPPPPPRRPGIRLHRDRRVRRPWPGQRGRLSGQPPGIRPSSSRHRDRQRPARTVMPHLPASPWPASCSSPAPSSPAPSSPTPSSRPPPRTTPPPASTARAPSTDTKTAKAEAARTD